MKVNISIDADAATGSRNVIVANPDGESVKKDSVLKIEAVKPPDPNGDGEVNILDMVIVAISFGQKIPSPPPAQNPDVNGDGEVNIFDLVLIGRRFGEKLTPKASPVRDLDHQDQEIISEALLDVNLLTQLRELLRSIPNANAGILKAIAELERLIVIARAKKTPSETKLLANYPNPFNPETWIPYQLANSAEVSLRIYDVAGKLVRTLNLGKRDIGLYMTKERAAYWDGSNEMGERIASGVYFYQLQAGSFSDMRKMLMVK